MLVGRSVEESERMLQVWFITSWDQPAQVCCISDKVSAPPINSHPQPTRGYKMGQSHTLDLVCLVHYVGYVPVSSLWIFPSPLGQQEMETHWKLIRGTCICLWTKEKDFTTCPINPKALYVKLYYWQKKLSYVHTIRFICFLHLSDVCICFLCVFTQRIKLVSHLRLILTPCWWIPKSSMLGYKSHKPDNIQ